jgi:hypothetical protein
MKAEDLLHTPCSFSTKLARICFQIARLVIEVRGPSTAMPRCQFWCDHSMLINHSALPQSAGMTELATCRIPQVFAIDVIQRPDAL